MESKTAMNTHRVIVTASLGDARPSRKTHRSNRVVGTYEWETTEHGAKTIFGRELNIAQRREFQVATEELAHNAEKPDRRVVYVVTQIEGITYTDTIVQERWPRYEGMYDQDAVNDMVNSTATRHAMDSEWD